MQPQQPQPQEESQQPQQQQQYSSNPYAYADGYGYEYGYSSEMNPSSAVAASSVSAGAATVTVASPSVASSAVASADSPPPSYTEAIQFQPIPTIAMPPTVQPAAPYPMASMQQNGAYQQSLTQPMQQPVPMPRIIPPLSPASASASASLSPGYPSAASRAPVISTEAWQQSQRQRLQNAGEGQAHIHNQGQAFGVAGNGQVHPHDGSNSNSSSHSIDGPTEAKLESASSNSCSSHSLLIFSLLVLSLLIAFSVKKYEDDHTYRIDWWGAPRHTWSGATIALLVCMCIAALIYLIIAFNTVTWSRLWSGKLEEPLQQYVQRMKSARPALVLHCRCSHEESRSRTDSEGRSETYYETVVTYREQKEFAGVSDHDMVWTDGSDNPPSSLRTMTQVECSSQMVWGDEVAKSRFELMKFEMIERNKNRDRDFHYWDEFTIPGLIEHALTTPQWENVRGDIECNVTSGIESNNNDNAGHADMESGGSSTQHQSQTPVWRWWVSSWVYFICTFLLLAWPYVFVFNRSCQRTKMTFRKKICYSPRPRTQLSAADMAASAASSSSSSSSAMSMPVQPWHHSPSAMISSEKPYASSMPMPDMTTNASAAGSSPVYVAAPIPMAAPSAPGSSPPQP